jgi:hypothetical protein
MYRLLKAPISFRVADGNTLLIWFICHIFTILARKLRRSTQLFKASLRCGELRREAEDSPERMSFFHALDFELLHPAIVYYL